MNDGGWYKVSWNEQANASGYVDKAMGACRVDIDGMKTETDTMLSQWDPGATRDAFSQRQQMWLDSANEIVDILGRFKASLSTSADISSSTETSNSNIMAV